jgi:hypothetical protein
MLVARDVVPGRIAALLWLGAAGGRLIALAAELRGQAARRGSNLTRLWRFAGWVAGTSLAWPLLTDAGFSEHRFHPLEFIVLAAPVFLASALWRPSAGRWRAPRTALRACRGWARWRRCWRARQHSPGRGRAGSR